jgi:hypothetical protein
MGSDDVSERPPNQRRELLKTQFQHLQVTLVLLNEQLRVIADHLRAPKEDTGRAERQSEG